MVRPSSTFAMGPKVTWGVLVTLGALKHYPRASIVLPTVTF